ncbi:MAG: DUF1127 domain-containing protein [Rhodospirillales bacterium]|jgi:uncharacterized protein YjiS (DUF1127 family)|nr:DUF1127 domain-containing protein [Rhodospirillales bacterium]MDP6804524.1 DUF1127 domain-containing protein [Rhodospirillales bacterium]
MSFVGSAPFADTWFALRGSAPARHVAAPARAADTIFEWYDRARQRHRLAALDARMLADIGVTRAAAISEAEKPFWRP